MRKVALGNVPLDWDTMLQKWILRQQTTRPQVCITRVKDS